MCHRGAQPEEATYPTASCMQLPRLLCDVLDGWIQATVHHHHEPAQAAA